jgi:hypothetical protein
MFVVEAPNTASNSDDDHHVRMAVLACVSFWQQHHHSNASRFEQDASSWCGSHHIHTHCSVMDIHVPHDGTTTTCNDDTTTTTTTSFTTTSGSTYQLSPMDTFQIVSIRILKSIHSHHSSSQWNAPQAAAVQIVSSPQQQSSSSSFVVGGVPTTAGWMVLLRNCTHQWQCISGAIVVVGVPTTSSTTNTTTTTTLPIPRSVVTPFDFQQVMSCVWDGYCMANRMCDGTAMAQVFHATCRLTYVDNDDDGTTAPDDDDGIRILDCTQFCQKVSNRYTSERPHIPYAQFRHDPRAACGDELLAMEFATPYVAMVTLKVGHPPFLWTDLLTCAQLGTKWYIVHKSSTSEPFLVNLLDSK